MNNSFFTGIDIGSDRIKIFTISSDADNFSKASDVSFGVLNGYIQNKKEVARSLQRVLITAAGKIQSPISKAIFGIDSIGLNSRVLLISKTLSMKKPVELTSNILEELERSVQSKPIQPLHIQLTLLPIEYELDGYKSFLNPVGSIASKITVKYLQVLAPANHIRMIENIAEISDIEIEDIFPTAMASAMYILKKEEKDSGAIYIDFGHSVTSYVFIKNGQPYKIRTINFGSDKLSEVIALKLKISKKDAENIKKRPPLDSKKRELVGKIISNYIKNMFLEINKDVKKVNVHGDFFASGIVLAGAGSRLKDIEYVFSKFFKMPVRKIIDPNIESEYTSYTGAYSIAAKHKKNFKDRNIIIAENVEGIFSKIKKFLRK